MNDMATAIPWEINDTFDLYIAELEKKQKELLESNINVTKLLWTEKDSLEKVIADMTTTQNFMKRALQKKLNFLHQEMYIH